MLTSKEVFKTVTMNEWELNQAHKDGYLFVEVFYEEYIETQTITEQKPVSWTITYSSNSIYPNPNWNNDYNQPQYETITKQVPIVKRVPRALFRLGDVAAVIYGKD